MKKSSSSSRLLSLIKPALPPKPSFVTKPVTSRKPQVPPKPAPKNSKPAVAPKPITRRKSILGKSDASSDILSLSDKSKVIRTPKQRSAGRLPKLKKTPGWTSPNEELFRRPINMPSAHVYNTRRTSVYQKKVGRSLLDAESLPILSPSKTRRRSVYSVLPRSPTKRHVRNAHPDVLVEETTNETATDVHANWKALPPPRAGPNAVAINSTCCFPVPIQDSGPRPKRHLETIVIASSKMDVVDHTMDVDHKMDVVDHKMNVVDHKMDVVDHKMNVVDHKMDVVDEPSKPAAKKRRPICGVAALRRQSMHQEPGVPSLTLVSINIDSPRDEVDAKDSPRDEVDAKDSPRDEVDAKDSPRDEVDAKISDSRAKLASDVEIVEMTVSGEKSMSPAGSGTSERAPIEFFTPAGKALLDTSVYETPAVKPSSGTTPAMVPQSDTRRRHRIGRRQKLSQDFEIVPIEAFGGNINDRIVEDDADSPLLSAGLPKHHDGSRCVVS